MAAPTTKPVGKQTKFAQESGAQAAEQDAVDRPYIKDDSEKAWDAFDGQEFGGQAGIVDVKENEVAGPFTYTGHQEIVTDLGAVTVHTGTDDDGAQWRLPIQATFLRAVDQARLQMGDKFAIKRYDDTVKKRGKGAGNPMAIYAIKVLERSATGISTTK